MKKQELLGILKLSVVASAALLSMQARADFPEDKTGKLQLATGQLYPSQGTVRVLGQSVWNNSSLNRFIGRKPGFRQSSPLVAQ